MKGRIEKKQQLVGVLNQAQQMSGTLAGPLVRGFSAYDIAVMEGYVGTQEEWLETLRGKEGAVGPQGPKGDPGEAGPKGNDGYTPVKGVDYFDGQPGDTGKAGNGIASTVLNADYTLTLTFTDGTSYTTPSIRGEQGIQGPKGEKGDTGEQGAQGPKGDLSDDEIALKEDIAKDMSWLLKNIKQGTRPILNIEFEKGTINAENGIQFENNNCVRTTDFIDLSLYDEFIFNNLRQWAYNGYIIYYNDDKSYNSYMYYQNFTRDTTVNKVARYIKIVIIEAYPEAYPISDWNKYFYFEGVINKQIDDKMNSLMDNIYDSLAIDEEIILSNKINKSFFIDTAELADSTAHSYVIDVKAYERYNITLNSFIKIRNALVVLTDDDEKPYKIFARGENSLKNYEANIEIPSYITKMYVLSTDGNLPVVCKQVLSNHTIDASESIWNGKKAVFLGDSITAGSWYNPTLETWENMTENWTYWVSKICGMKYKNYGIGGTHVSSAYNSGDGSRAEQAFTNRYSNMDDDADVVFVMGGTNDWLPNHADTSPFGTISDNTDVSFCGAIRVLCEGLIKKYNGKQIFFLTPICNANQLTANPTTGKTLQEYCDVIKEICGMYSIEVIDTHINAPLHFMITENANKYCSQQDGSTHPNDLGQKLLGEYVARVIN